MHTDMCNAPCVLSLGADLLRAVLDCLGCPEAALVARALCKATRALYPAPAAPLSLRLPLPEWAAVLAWEAAQRADADPAWQQKNRCQPGTEQHAALAYYHQRKALARVAGTGALRNVQALRERGCSWDTRASCEAARRGHLQVLRWLRAQEPPCPWDGDTCAAAARGGHLEVLRWLRAQKPRCPWNSFTCDTAAMGGHVHVLEWARAQRPRCPRSDGVCYYASKAGHVRVLQWARANGHRWDGAACDNAAGGGHLEALRWLRAQDPPCPWTAITCTRAVRGGHLDVLRWLRAPDQPGVGGRPDPPCPWAWHTCSAAVQRGDFQALRWLRAQDPPCPWNEDACTVAAYCGRLEMLQWLRAQDPPCPWKAGDVCRMAIAGGPHADVVQWAHAHGCPHQGCAGCEDTGQHA